MQKSIRIDVMFGYVKWIVEEDNSVHISVLISQMMGQECEPEEYLVDCL